MIDLTKKLELFKSYRLVGCISSEFDYLYVTGTCSQRESYTKYLCDFYFDNSTGKHKSNFVYTDGWEVQDLVECDKDGLILEDPEVEEFYILMDINDVEIAVHHPVTTLDKAKEIAGDKLLENGCINGIEIFKKVGFMSRETSIQFKGV